MLGPLLNRKSDLSVRNGVLLYTYKQLICPLTDYACLAWASASRTHVRRLQVFQSKCLYLATGAPWYVSSRQIHEDLGVPHLADHIRGQTASFDSKLPDLGKPLVRQIDRYLRWLRVDLAVWCESQGRRGRAGQSRHHPQWPSRLNESCSALVSRAPLGYPDWGFSVIFPQLWGKCQGIRCKFGAQPALPSTRLSGFT